MYIVVAEKQGVSKKEIGGTIQNDMLKEFIAQKTFMLPPKPSLRIIVDTVEYCAKEVPRWNTISISGDSKTMSTPSSFQGSSAGSLTENTLNSSPSTEMFPFLTSISALEVAQHRVVLQKVRQCLGRRDVVDGHEIHVVVAQ